MRWLLVGLALLALPAVAVGQSDTRKVAVWMLQGEKVHANGQRRTTGNGEGGTTGAALSQCHATVTDILDRMGVPYDIFLPADSANW